MLDSVKSQAKDTAKTQAKDSAGSAGAAALTKQLKNVQSDNGPIVFKSGKSEIDVDKSKKTLSTISTLIVATSGLLVRVEGHTDNVGNAKANLKLSQDRAQAVVDYLIKNNNVDGSRLAAKGFGDTQPIADNNTPEGQAKNRRVDFSVTTIK